MVWTSNGCDLLSAVDVALLGVTTVSNDVKPNVDGILGRDSSVHVGLFNFMNVDADQSGQCCIPIANMNGLCQDLASAVRWKISTGNKCRGAYASFPITVLASTQEKIGGC
jgi:hypothetical protein